MRVLYVTFHPDALSESYIRTEVEWMQSQGVDVCMLAQSSHNSRYEHSISMDNLMYGNNLKAAVERYKPDIIHIHWLMLIDWYLRDALREGVGVPVSFRGHSFDYSKERVKEAFSFPDTRVVWLFPHFAKEVSHLHPKVEALVPCFDPKRYYPGNSKRHPVVMRTFAGLPSKKIEDWFTVAKLCPDVIFHLVMTRAMPSLDGYPEEVKKMAPKNVMISVNLSHNLVAEAMRESKIYLVTKPSHRFGMPVSIGEALGSGLRVLLPNDGDLWLYSGLGCSFYNTLGEAAEYIRVLAGLDEEPWYNMQCASAYQSANYKDHNVLPRVLDKWQRIVKGEDRNGV